MFSSSSVSGADRRSSLVAAILGLLCLFSPTVHAEQKVAVVESLDPGDIVEYAKAPSEVRSLIETSLRLTRKNLGYRFGSHDVAKGGMDCSGTVYRVLSDLGLQPPRSSRAIFRWVEEAKTLHRVPAGTGSLGHDSFEQLSPGDLVFWSGTYNTGKGADAISHVMIYLGTSRLDGKPVLFGASSGRRFRGTRIHGVSVFDFQLPSKGSRSVFVGYGAIPGLR